ncbi:DUF6625 family protein [Flagellimonas oceanensis]|uniref:DUF6625 family protein n=1 Tax=Flagellimonas oceanensis TaxID=2499163 RepID=UPI000F8DE299|nr:DUF6625 family protein [Allomuricauda oceanensis]
MGDFPWFFDYFIKSCEHNPTIDFYIFCNTSYDGEIPENVSLLNLTLDEFNLIASSKLKLTVSIEDAYKLCDFKPAYGVIFSEYLIGYDFWGVCDLDIVFGQIREFMTESLLSEYDVISGRPDFPTGYFMLFRNEKEVNYLFTKSRDYKMIFGSQKHYCFDECNFKHDYLTDGYSIFDISCEIESMHHVLIKEKNNIRVFWDFLIIEGLPGNLKWVNGQLVFMERYETLLYHFKLFKNNILTKKKNSKAIPKKFKIYRYHIQNYSYNLFKISYNYLKYEIFNPYYHFLSQRIDYYISVGLNRRNHNQCSSDSEFSDGKIFLRKSEGKYTFLAYNKEFRGQRLIIPSIFKTNTFYVREKSFTTYIISHFSEHKINFRTIDIAGFSYKFQLKKTLV